MDRVSLNVEIRVGESITIDNGRVVLTLQEKSGQRARLNFNAERSVTIDPVRIRPQAETPG